MKAVIASAALTLLCAACDAEPPPADEGVSTDPAQLPQRKAGLWRREISLGSEHRAPEDLCFEAGPILSHNEPDETCALPRVSRQADGALKIIDDCRAMDGQARTRSVAIWRGDPARKFSVSAKAWASENGEPLRRLGRQVDMTFTYLGDCGGARPG